VTAPTIPDEEVTERTAALLRHPDNRDRDGYDTPCEEWLRDDQVNAHAATCPACRKEASDAK